MSLDAHPERKRQSDQTTKTLPAPSMLTDGKFGLRRPAATKWLWMLAMAWLSSPAHASIGGAEYIDASTFKRYDDGPIRLHDGLAAETTGMVGRGKTWSPGFTAVFRNAHQHIAAAKCLIPLGVAVAIERAGRGVVADGPILVVEMSVIDDDGIAPVQAIGRTADGDVTDKRATAQARERQRGDEPCAMLGVEGNRRIGGGAVGSSLVVEG